MSLLFISSDIRPCMGCPVGGVWDGLRTTTAHKDFQPKGGVRPHETEDLMRHTVVPLRKRLRRWNTNKTNGKNKVGNDGEPVGKFW